VDLHQVERQQTVFNLLHELNGVEPLKELFWTELNYSRVNRPLSRKGWGDGAADALAGDPVLFAAGGDDFHIIHARLDSGRLPMGAERPVVSRLLQQHPYALFVFSNGQQNRWHFLNIKYDGDVQKRRIFRRITVGPDERLRTASERLTMLDLESISADLSRVSPLAIQTRHDEAFDVELVTKEFFQEYRRVFEEVEKRVEGIKDAERKRLFTQRLFNRLMFVAFIQKKGWLKFGKSTDYLAALWQDYQKNMKSKNRNFYSDRLKLLFFSGLNTPNEVNVIGINGGGLLKELIGQVPYLNGGLFEQDDGDRDPKMVVHDDSIDAILNELFSRFNFTVTESTPLDIEVAVDPEMLGKMFEELVTGRHETGSYYTPKPVVSFMCKEALKGYLRSQVPAESESSIEKFVEQHDPSALNNAEAVLEAMRTIRVCDPACGSGAYPLGMLHELLDLRHCLFATRRLDPISTYQRKLEIIQNNLYGVDIDPFAVNIARLRLWLSLAVDFEGDSPQPLPNLDFKIEVGDSLATPNPSGGLEQGFRKTLIEEYLKAKTAFMTAHGSTKVELRKKVAGLKEAVTGWAHPNGKVAGFDWPVEFAEVFLDGGFDVIVANPPYVRQELIKDRKPLLKQTYPAIYMGTADVYCYFYGRGVELLGNRGMLVFISSNKWFRANYGAKLREYIARRCEVRSITDFGELPVFQAATFPTILVAGRSELQGAAATSGTVFTQVKSLDPPYPDVLRLIREQGELLPPGAISGSTWTLTDASSAARLRTMERSAVPLGDYVEGRIYFGIKTGLNEAFVLDGDRRAKVIAGDPKSDEIIKPLVVGDDVRRWRANFRDRWLIVTPVGIDIKRYPAVFKHLKQWQPELEQRWDKGDHWWELRPCDYYAAFDKPKIIYPDIAKEPRFAFDDKGLCVNNTTYFLAVHDLYLLGVLNSRTMWDYAKQRFSVLGDASDGGRLRFFRQFVRTLPIPDASSRDRAAISTLVQKCVDAKGIGCEKWEKEIDERVAALYGL
jgi:type I restriction-modification system DNA methylase subunit